MIDTQQPINQLSNNSSNSKNNVQFEGGITSANGEDKKDNENNNEEAKNGNDD